jgi:hypothetical protein
MKERIVLEGFAAVLAVLLGAAGMAFAQVPVTECGQTVEGDAYLAGDLDCTGFVGEDPTGAAIILLSSHGRLDLRGFTLTGGLYVGVSCVERCNAPHNRCGPYQIRTARCDVFDSVGGGVITGAWQGVSADSVRVRDVTLSNHVYDAIGVNGRVMLRSVTLTGNNVSVDTDGLVRVYDSTITGNARFGIAARTILLRNSTVTGNGFVPGCDPHDWQNRCADLDSSRKPRLRNSTCDTSTGKPYLHDGRRDWGVCSLD